MKMTLLDMTQSILSSMNSDEVNSIGDTVESRQVADAIKTTYFNILARADLPEAKTLFSLTASTDEDLPVLMIRPDNVVRIDWIKYNISDNVSPLSEPDYRVLTALSNFDFIAMVNTYGPLATDVEAYTFNGKKYYYKNNEHPHHFTVVQDRYVLFDSYDASEEATLQESKVLCAGLTSPEFLMEDDFIPELDARQFPLLLNEAKSLCFLDIKQVANNKAELESRRQWRTLQRTKSLVANPTDFERLPDFGRRGRYAPTAPRLH